MKYNLLIFIFICYQSIAQVQISDHPGDEWHSLWMNNDSSIMYSVRHNGLSNIKIKNIYTGSTNNINLNNIGDCYFTKCCDESPLIVFDGLENNISPYVIYTHNLDTEQTEILIDIPYVGCVLPNMSYQTDQLVFFMAGSGISLYDFSSGEIDLIIDNTYDNMHPGFSPDGKKLLYTSDRSGNYDIWVYDFEEDTHENLTENPAWDDRAVWSSDGQFIVFQSDRSGNDDIWMMQLNNKELHQLTFETYAEMSPAISNDGTKISYSSNKDGNFNVYYVFNPLVQTTEEKIADDIFSLQIIDNNISIKINNKIQTKVRFTLADISGKIISTNDYDEKNNQDNISLHSHSLPQGTYIVNAQWDDKRLSKKIVLK